MGKFSFYATRLDMISIVAKNNEKFNLMRGDGKLLLNRWFDEINENQTFLRVESTRTDSENDMALRTFERKGFQ